MGGLQYLGAKGVDYEKEKRERGRPLQATTLGAVIPRLIGMAFGLLYYGVWLFGCLVVWLE